MGDVYKRIANATSVAEAIELPRIDAVSRGVRYCTYHVSEPHKSQVGPNVYVATYGFPDEWVAAYHEYEVRRHDPIPDRVMRLGEAMTFAQALEGVSLTPRQESFISRLRAAGYFETMAIPVYGPYDFDTYATFSLGRPVEPTDGELVQHLIALVEISNRRVAHLLEKEKVRDIALSERESEVLKWLGGSKSNGDIATILNVSAATIDTYVRRIFAKLGVNDRMAAAVKGIRLGLIRY